MINQHNDPFSMRQPLFCSLVASSIVLAGCGSDGGTTAPDAPARPLTIVSGSGITDTIGAKPLQAVVVEVRVGGVLKPGVTVRFDAVPTTDALRKAESTVLVSRLSGNSFSTFLADSTDASGRVRALVQLGTIAGPAQVAISVPELGLADTAKFTVAVGNAAKFLVSVRDTVVSINTTYSIGAAVRDRAGNARAADVVSYSTTSTFVAVDNAGVVKTLVAGRAKITLTSGTYSDSAKVSVMPQGTLAGVWLENGQSIATVNFDGTGLKKLTPVNSSVMLPRWLRTGGKIVFYEGDPNSDAKVYTVDEQGVRQTLISTAPSLSAAFWPAYSPDGQSVYFTGQSNGGRWSLWRANADGTAPTRLAFSGSVNYSEADPSPDGRKLVFSAGGVISTFDLTNGGIAGLGATGDFPKYSPDGTRILYLSGGALSVMNADGTGQRSLSGRNYDLYGAMNWTPDGNWILAGTTLGPELVSAKDFDIVSLKLPRLAQPTVR